MIRRGSTTAFHQLVAGSAAFALATAPTLVSAQAVGTNAAVRGSVQIKRTGAAQSQPAVLRQRVSINDEVGTGAASQLQVLLIDRSIFTVGANATLKIDRFVYDPSRNARAVGASVTRGAFRFMSGRNLGRLSGPVTVRTPIASIGVRGTIFEGVVGPDARRIAGAEPAVGANVGGDPATASLIILRGPGPRTTGDTRPGAIDVSAGGRTIVLDRPLLAAYAPGKGLPLMGPFQLSTAGLTAMQHLLRTVPAGGVTSQSSDAATRAANAPAPPASPNPRGGASPGRELAASGIPRVGLLLGALATALALVLVASKNDEDGPPVSP